MIVPEIQDKIKEIYERKYLEARELNESEISLIKAYKYMLLYVQNTLINPMIKEFMADKQGNVDDFKDYLDSQIDKYANQLQILNESFSKSKNTRRITDRINKVKRKLEEALKDKEAYEQRLTDYWENKIMREEDYLSQAYQELFSIDLLRMSRFYTTENDFYQIQDGKFVINTSNLHLVYEVLNNNKLDNFKRLVQMSELKNGISYLSEAVNFDGELMKLRFSLERKNNFIQKKLGRKFGFDNNLSLTSLIDKLYHYNYYIGCPTVEEINNFEKEVANLQENLVLDKSKEKNDYLIDFIKGNLKLLEEKIEEKRKEEIHKANAKLKQIESELDPIFLNANYRCMDRIIYYCADVSSLKMKSDILNNIEDVEVPRFTNVEKKAPIVNNINAIFEIEALKKMDYETLLALSQSTELDEMLQESKDVASEMVQMRPHR